MASPTSHNAWRLWATLAEATELGRQGCVVVAEGVVHTGTVRPGKCPYGPMVQGFLRPQEPRWGLEGETDNQISIRNWGIPRPHLHPVDSENCNTEEKAVYEVPGLTKGRISSVVWWGNCRPRKQTSASRAQKQGWSSGPDRKILSSSLTRIRVTWFGKGWL